MILSIVLQAFTYPFFKAVGIMWWKNNDAFTPFPQDCRL